MAVPHKIWLNWLALCLAGCAPGTLVGIVSPDQITSRLLRIRNESRQYIVACVTAPVGEAITTAAICPGGEIYTEMMMQFGTLCPESLRFEIAGYARAHPELSPLDDETLVSEPFASFAIELTSVRDYGCMADPSMVSLDTMIDCKILDADVQAGTLGFQAGFLPAQQQVGVQLADPPVPSEPEMFALRGDVIDSAGEPMPNVEIQLPQLGVSVFTDAQGQFSILRPVGSYILRPMLEGHEFSPVLQEFTHISPAEIPIEFIALPLP